jgi:hypothetical protein
MRIQETDRILKESRHARHSAAIHNEDGVVSRVWRTISSIPGKVSELFGAWRH